MRLPGIGSRPPIRGSSASTASRYIGISGTRTRWRWLKPSNGDSQRFLVIDQRISA